MTPLDLLAKLTSEIGVECLFLDANRIHEDLFFANIAGNVVRSRIVDAKASDGVVRKFLLLLFMLKVVVIELRIHLPHDEHLIFVIDAFEVLDLVDGFYFLGLEEARRVVPIGIFSVVSF